MARLGRGQSYPAIIIRPPAESDGSISGTLAVTTAADTLAAAGQVTVAGTLAKTNANDTLASAGQVTIAGTLAKTSTNDTLAASGSVGDAISGTLAKTNADDTIAASGSTTVAGTLAKTNADDTLAASGVAGSVTGTVAVTAGGDSLSAAGTGPASATVDGGGKWIPAKQTRSVSYHLGEAPPKRKKKPEPVTEPIREVSPEPPEPSPLTVLAGRIAELAGQALAQNAALSETDAQIAAFFAYQQEQAEAYERQLRQEDEDILILMLAA